VLPAASSGMRKTQIWRSHVTIPSLDNTVLLREPNESLATTLARLERLSVPTGADVLDVHVDA
jgi:hypothetical protein